MEAIKLDTGMQTYRINGKPLLMNPADPNLYGRFLEAGQQLQQIAEKFSAAPDEGIQKLQQADREMKQVLNRVFGEPNDFDEILDGVNLLAAARNGQPVLLNLLEALEPILLKGAERCVSMQVEQARNRAQQRRNAL